MISCKKALAAAVALIGLATVDAASEVKANDWNDADYCLWYKLQAMKTGDKYWWDRWRRCLRGDDWDTPRRNFGSRR